MNNYEAIKQYDLEEMALLFKQITFGYCNKSIDKLPTTEDWQTYLSSTNMFVPIKGDTK